MTKCTNQLKFIRSVIAVKWIKNSEIVSLPHSLIESFIFNEYFGYVVVSHLSGVKCAFISMNEDDVEEKLIWNIFQINFEDFFVEFVGRSNFENKHILNIFIHELNQFKEEA